MLDFKVKSLYVDTKVTNHMEKNMDDESRIGMTWRDRVFRAGQVCEEPLVYLNLHKMEQVFLQMFKRSPRDVVHGLGSTWRPMGRSSHLHLGL